MQIAGDMKIVRHSEADESTCKVILFIKVEQLSSLATFLPMFLVPKSYDKRILVTK